jgi:HlyD family secretion protein
LQATLASARIYRIISWCRSEIAMKKITPKNKRSGTRRIWIAVVAVLLIAAGGLGYYFWKAQTSQTVEATTSGLNTSQVRQGSINLSVSGSGTLAAGQESNLAFSASGTVAKVNVQISDKVKKGDVLAELSNLSELQDNINTAQQDLVSAQQALDTLKQSAASNLANAQLAVVQAQKAVTDAKSGVVQKGWVRCDKATLDAYYFTYMHDKSYLDTLGDGGGNADYYQSTILPQKNIVAQAKANYDYCAGYTDYEVSSSQATLLVDEANLQTAQATLDTLKKNNGVDPIELATAENKVSSAQLKVDTAKTALAGGTLTAPFDGTILSVAGLAGDSVGTGTFITIADLSHPLVNFSVDEADMDKLALDQTANVVFDALPEQTFQGKVTRIDPALSTSGNYKVVTGVIQLNLSQDSATSSASAKLLKGLTGTVTLVQASAENVLLVPLQALRDLGDGTYAVFVVGADGQPKMKIVEIGLKTDTSVEIKSGLKAGDVVSTGTVQTK